MSLRFLSLFSGIGGLDLGLERAGMHCAAQVEIDPYCRAVLAKHWPDVPRFDDVRTFNRASIADGSVELVCGGFPCQDISCAGRGAELEGQRSGLWWEMHRIIGEFRPGWVLAENVPALRTRGADDVLSSLEALGYAAWPLVVGAEHVGAPHRRHRVWIVARLDDPASNRRGRHPHLTEVADQRQEQQQAEHPPAVRRDAHEPERQKLAYGTRGGLGADRRAFGHTGHAHQRSETLSDGVADADVGGLGDGEDARTWSAQLGDGSRHVADAEQLARGRQGRQGSEDRRERDGHDAGRSQGAGGPEIRRHHRWPARPGEAQNEWEAPRLVEFGVGRAADGLPERLVRFANRNALRAFGNSVIPQIPEVFGRLIIEANNGPSPRPGGGRGRTTPAPGTHPKETP